MDRRSNTPAGHNDNVFDAYREIFMQQYDSYIYASDFKL